MALAALAQNEPFRRKAAVVDADRQVIAILQSVLDADEWGIVQVTDNAAVLKLAQSQPLDLIITGARTSGSEDVSLLHKIRRVQPHIRLIILTDDSTPADGIEVVPATPEWISVIVRCDTKTADRLVHFFREISDLPDPEKGNVAMAFHELLLNAMEHGGKFDLEQYVEISYVRTRKMIMCRIKDPGKGFALEEIKHAAINNPSYDPILHALFREKQGLRPGGYGVLIAKHLVDELVYSEKGNEVLLVKYLHSD